MTFANWSTGRAAARQVSDLSSFEDSINNTIGVSAAVSIGDSHEQSLLGRKDGRAALGRSLQLAVKRSMDIVGAFLALVLLGPLLIAIAIAVKLTSPGPILFRQPREGLNGEPFTIYKFRSMRIDAGDVEGTRQARAGDDRLTPIGGFIRAKSLDELPQLLNVLKGDMSLVGPRPHVPGMLAGGQLYRQLVPYYDLRLGMRPGITGWAQANGLRGPTEDPATAIARVQHDIIYIRDFSLLLDLRIIMMTVRNEFLSGSGL
jgi:lipopolysaccharide/colanic/teichoic acid biosynthesis glycosyltransferase